MPSKNRVCNEVINEVISRYSRVAFENGEAESPVESKVREGDVKLTEQDFWGWFCDEMNAKEFRDCFINNERDDFYGSLKAIRAEYESRCSK